MTDIEAEGQSQHCDLDDSANQACYIFQPSRTSDLNKRPAKRRKTTHALIEPASDFPLLSHGDEPLSLAQRRSKLLDREWQHKTSYINKVVSTLDEQSLEDIASFVKSPNNAVTIGTLRAGLVVSGPDTSVQTRLLNQWKAKQSSTSHELVVPLRSSSCPNLQAALKSVIKDVISSRVGPDGYHEFLAKHRRLIPMGFDLELLQLFVQEQNISKVVVSMLDIETFETGILSELLTSLASWSDRVPFVVLLGIATTVELFGSRLPRSVVSLLDAKVFTLLSPDHLQHRLLSDLQISPETRVFFGSLTLAAFHELSQGQGATIADFSSTLELAYMSHYFANPLAVLLDDSDIALQDTKALCEAIRNTNSFRRHCEKLLSAGLPSVVTLRELLDDDEKLLLAAHNAVVQGQKAFRDALSILAGLHDLRQKLGLRNDSPFLLDSQLCAQLDDLTTVPLIDETLANLEKLTSVNLLLLTKSLEQSTIDLFDISGQVKDLGDFDASHGSKPIRSTHNQPAQTAIPKPSSAPTKETSIPSKTAPETTSAENNFTAILESIISQITSQVQTMSFDLQSTLLHEAFVYNSRQPLQSSFTPRPRFALERALSRPGDYLGCDCCSGTPHDDGEPSEAEGRNRSAPPTSILYNLLQEAGTIINVRDLFDAFSSRLHPHSASSTKSSRVNGINGLIENANGNEDNEEDDNDDEEDEDEIDNPTYKSQQRTSLALFYRSLSELKMLGLVKSSSSTMIKKKALASKSGGSALGGTGGDMNGSTSTGAGAGASTGIGGRRPGYAEIDFIAKTSWEGM